MKKAKRIKLFNDLEKNFIPLREGILRLFLGGDWETYPSVDSCYTFHNQATLESFLSFRMWSSNYVEAVIYNLRDGQYEGFRTKKCL